MAIFGGVVLDGLPRSFRVLDKVPLTKWTELPSKLNESTAAFFSHSFVM